MSNYIYKNIYYKKFNYILNYGNQNYLSIITFTLIIISI
jgi:hypothetical protein